MWDTSADNVKLGDVIPHRDIKDRQEVEALIKAKKSAQTSSNGTLVRPESVFLLLPAASTALDFLAGAFFCFGGIFWKKATN